MLQKTTKLPLFVRKPFLVVYFAFLLSCLVSISIFAISHPADASTPTLNFQARLLTSSGAIVPDGDYNVEFKIYSGASCAPTTGSGCTTDWGEDYFGGSTDNRLRVADGYLTANLGSITALSNTIPWGDQLYLSINIGGTTDTSTPTLDGTMFPYLSLTATPYSMNSNELGGLTASQFGQLSGDQAWTGANTIQATAPAALSVQTASGASSVFTVDTSSNEVDLGSDTSLILQGSTAAISNPQGQAQSEAFGAGASVTSTQATAVGNDAEVTGLEGTALGYQAISGQQGLALGSGSSAHANSVAIGGGATTTDYYSVALGGASAAAEYGIAIGQNATAGYASIAIGPSSATTGNGQVVIGGNSGGTEYNYTDLYLGSGVTDANPQSARIHATGGSGTNIQGASLSIAGGVGTGDGNGGNINFQIAAPSGSGSGANTLSTVESLSGASGAALFQNAANSTTAFQIQASGNSTSVFDVDTANGRVGINTNSPGYALDVNGVINSNTSVDVNGVSLCTTACTPAAGSGNYIQNGTSVQTNANLFIRGVGSASPSAVIQGASGQTGDLLDLQTWNGSSSTTVDKIDSSGDLDINNTSTIALQVQNSSGDLLDVDTSGDTVVIGASGPSAISSTVDIATSTSTTNVQSVVIGSSTDVSNTISIEGGTGSTGIQIGNDALTHGIQIGTGAGAETVKVGSTSSTSATTVQAGSGGLALQAGASGAVTIGNQTGTTANSLTIGNSSASDTISIGTTSTLAITSSNFKLSTAGVVTLAGGQTQDITVAAQTTSNAAGNNLTVQSATGNGTGAGGNLNLQGGISGSGSTGNGGAVNISGGNAGSTSGNGGSIVLSGGLLSGTGTNGGVSIPLVGSGSTAGSTAAFSIGAAGGGTLFNVNNSGTNGNHITIGNNSCTSSTGVGKLCVNFSQANPSGSYVTQNTTSGLTGTSSGSNSVYNNMSYLNDTSTGGTNALYGFDVISTGTTNASTAINSFSATIPNSQTGNFLLLQNASSTTLFGVSNAGVVTLAGGQTQDITTIVGSTANGITIQPGGSNIASGTGAGLTLQAGNETGGTSSTGGSVTIQSGTGTTAGNITLKAGSGTINVGNDGSVSHTISVGSSTPSANSVIETIKIGDSGSTSNTSDLINTTIGPTAGDTVGGTTTLQSEGLSDTITGSSSAPSDVIQTTTNSTLGFEVTNNSGNSVFTVDTSGNNVVIGKASSITGNLQLANSSSANLVTLNAGNTSAAYTLTLPTTGATGNECLESTSGSTSSSTSLQFTSCSSGGGSSSLEQAYTTSAGANPSITTTSGNGGVIVQNASSGGISSGSIFGVSDSTGSILSVTSGDSLVVGSGSTGESTPKLLVLDNETSSSSDPVGGVNGAMYYNVSLGRFRCYENGGWKNCIGIDSQDARISPLYSTDFLSAGTGSTAPWTINPIGTNGSYQHMSSPPSDHPGVIQFLSTTSCTVTCGYSVSLMSATAQTNYSSLTLGGGEQFEAVFEPATLDASTQDYFGFIDNNTGVASTNGVYMSLTGTGTTGTLSGVTANGGTRSTTGTSATLSTTTWYRLDISMNANATTATYTLYTGGSTTPTWTDSLSTNIPTTNGTSNGITSTYSTTATAKTLLNVDYMAIWYSGRALNR
jgi:hypothetical protein